MDNRREFLKKIGLLAGGTGLAHMLPFSIQQALAIDPLPGSTFMDAEHIVILMQENRSFDHCFGTLQGVRGFNDPRAITLPNNNLVWLQSNNAGQTYAPFRLDIKDTKATWMDSLPHSWQNQVDARNDGKHDQWLNVKRNSIKEFADMPLTMGYYNRQDIPFYYSMADAFTVCDQHFCSSLTGTNPNRLYFWTGTVRAEQHENSRAHVWNDDMDYGTLLWKTFPERLEDHDISWKFYQNETSIDVGFNSQEDAWLSNFQDNPLEFFGQYNIRLHAKHLDHLEKTLHLPADQIQDLRNTFDQLSVHEKNIHQKAFSTNTGDPFYHELENLKYDDSGVARELQVPKGDVLHQFRQDVNNGHLPTVSWLASPESFSDHPSAAWFGAWYVSEVMDILTKNPEVWKKTIFILTYDENDGYFDHVAPFTASDPRKPSTGKTSAGIDTRVDFVTRDQELQRGGFPEKYERESSIGLGFRVPLLIASPWSRGGWVNSQVFDHTSTLQFLEKFLQAKTGKKIEEPNISNWRRTVCGDLTSVFRPYEGEVLKNPSFLAKDDFMEGIHKSKFKKLPSYHLLTEQEIASINQNPYASLLMPQQERGIRPSSGLPYELHVDGKLNADKKNFEITFAAKNELFGNDAAGSAFNVYAPGKYIDPETKSWVNVKIWAYTVAAGQSLMDGWPLEAFENRRYHLRVFGPNGFFREYSGDAAEPLLDISLNYQSSKTNSRALSGDLELKMANTGTAPIPNIEIIDHAYKTNNHKKSLSASEISVLVLNLAKSYGWYDFSIRIPEYPLFEKRFAGRVETGKSSFSDPFMGRLVG